MIKTTVLTAGLALSIAFPLFADHDSPVWGVGTIGRNGCDLVFEQEGGCEALKILNPGGAVRRLACRRVEAQFRSEPCGIRILSIEEVYGPERDLVIHGRVRSAECGSPVYAGVVDPCAPVESARHVVEVANGGFSLRVPLRVSQCRTVSRLQVVAFIYEEDPDCCEPVFRSGRGPTYTYCRGRWSSSLPRCRGGVTIVIP